MNSSYATYDELIQFRTGTGLSMADYGEKLNDLMIKAQSQGAIRMNVSWSEEDGLVLKAVRTVGLRRTEMEQTVNKAGTAIHVLEDKKLVDASKVLL